MVSAIELLAAYVKETNYRSVRIGGHGGAHFELKALDRIKTGPEYLRPEDGVPYLLDRLRFVERVLARPEKPQPGCSRLPVGERPTWERSLQELLAELDSLYALPDDYRRSADLKYVKVVGGENS